MLIFNRMPNKATQLQKVIIVALLALSSSMCVQASADQDVIEKLDMVTELKGVSKKAQSASQGGWLPVPIPVVNPTVGSGLFGALLYMHPQKNADPTTPTATSGIGALYTDSKSWFTGAFHDDYLKSDQFRYKVLAGTGEFNLDYYGVGGGDDEGLEDDPIAYRIESDLIALQFLSRIGIARNWYLGVRHLWSSSGVTFNVDDEPLLPDVSSRLATSSLGVLTSYDSKNDNYYPTNGQYFEAFISKDSDKWGSDFEYDKLTTYYNYYWPLTQKATLAMRAYLSVLDGDAPFYMLPTLKMRGFPSGQYRNQSAVSGHIEWRHKVHQRWTTILFTEVGSVGRTVSAAFDKSAINSYGAGVRWQVLPSKTLNLGVDFAFSGDDSAMYIQVGERY